MSLPPATNMSPSRRPNTRASLASLAPPPSTFDLLSSLPPEVIDQVLAYVAPFSSRSTRRQLGRLLLLSRSITPHVRRKLFHRVSLTLGDTRGKDAKLLEMMEGGTVGEYVRYSKIKAPLPKEAEGDDPRAAMIPRTTMGYTQAISYMTKLLNVVKNLKHLEIETAVGTSIVEAESHVYAPLQVWSGETEDAIEPYIVALCALDLESFTMAVEDISNALQLIRPRPTKHHGDISPYPTALASWANLTFLDLWRVDLSLTDDDPWPTFRLQSLTIQSSTFKSETELFWLLGKAGGERSARLSTLVIRDLTFTSHPESSEPLLSIFPPNPSFATTLTTLMLALQFPLFRQDPDAPHDEALLSPFTSLTKVNLRGAGMTLPVLQSLLPLPSSPASSPSHSIVSLMMDGTTSIPLSDLLTVLSTRSAWPKLVTLELQTSGSPPRSWTWDQIHSTPIASWDLPPPDLTKLREWTKARKGGVLVKIDGLELSLEEEEDEDETESEESEGDGLFRLSSDGDVEDWDGRMVSGEESDY
jgi:hypothetical protein